MSRTSDAAVEQILQHAQAAGMRAAELAGWRMLFDKVARDACGCVAGLIGLAIALVLGTAVLLPTGGSWWWLLPVSLLGALCGLVIGQRRAARRRQLVLGRLQARMRGLPTAAHAELEHA